MTQALIRTRSTPWQAAAVPAELAAALSDDMVRQMALRAAGLSDRSLKAITTTPATTPRTVDNEY